MSHATEPDDILPPPGERVILWYRASCEGACEQASERAQTVATRCEVVGGTVLTQVGLTVVASFDPIDVEDTIELGLDVLAGLRAASRSSAQAAQEEATIGIAMGTVRPQPGRYEGGAIDRAQLLANRARAGELAVDDFVHAHTEATHLCQRVLHSDGAGGQIIDARFPLKRDCRGAVRHLRAAAMPDNQRVLFEHISGFVAEEAPRHRLILESPEPSTAMEWIGRLRDAHSPGLLLHFGRQAGGLQPLGGFALALRRLGGALDAVEIDAAMRATLVAVRSGAAVLRTDARKALLALMAAVDEPWIVLDRLREIDAPSLSIVAEATRAAARKGVADPLVLMTVAEREGVPAALLRTGEHERIALPRLDGAGARQVATQVLGARTGADVARRVAQVGGDTVLGVQEAARTLVCSGDLVYSDGAYRWRTAPRSANMAIPTDSLITERIHGLDMESKRTLEALCLAPPAMGAAFVARVAEMDGLSSEEVQTGMASLAAEGWLHADGDLGPLAQITRNAVREDMPPARAAELHRFIADVLADDGYGGVSFGSALLATHQGEGGRESEAAGSLLDTAQAATDAGFERIAVRLAAFALKLHDSVETKTRARSVARTVDSRPATRRQGAEPTAPLTEEIAPPSASTIAHNAVRSAIASIVGGRPDAAEGFLDTAVAAGWNRAAAQRLWSMALLAKGDLPSAVRTFKRACRPDPNAATRGREALTAALILLEAGELLAAVRSALEGLGAARDVGDERGAQAALLVLSACYRALGRDDDAARIEAAA